MNIEQPEITVQALVLASRDSGVTGKRLDIVTLEKGRMVVFVPQGRRIGRHGGAVLPGSRMHMTLRYSQNGWQVVQADGTTLVDVFMWTYEDWLCYYAYPRWLGELFPVETEEIDLYQLTERYLCALVNKHFVISTLIVCWQASVLAGYDPMVLAAEGKLPLDNAAKRGLQSVLSYTWENATPMVWKSGMLLRLAQTLIYFAQYHVGVNVPAFNELVKEKY